MRLVVLRVKSASIIAVLTLTIMMPQMTSRQSVQRMVIWYNTLKVMLIGQYHPRDVYVRFCYH